MKKWFSILMFSVLLVTTTEAYQLLKIPILIEHFLEHKTSNPEITLMVFLKMHYDYPQKDDDYHTDQRLPFVSHSTLLAQVYKPEAPFELKINWVLPPRSSKKQLHTTEPRINSGSFDAIWQPPRTC